MASIVIKDSFKAGKDGIDFSYVRPNGEVKTTRLKKKFSDTINGEKVTFLLPENPTAEQMFAHAEALANRYVRQHVAGQAKAAKMTDAERAEARQRGLDNWNNMTAEQKAAHAKATEVNAEAQREAWKALKNHALLQWHKMLLKFLMTSLLNWLHWDNPNAPAPCVLVPQHS